MNYQDDVEQMTTWTDSDWAGCVTTRRSTSGGIISHGTHFIKAWARTQAVVALSSAEAELYASVKTTAETLGVISLFRDIGVTVSGVVLTDASATLSLIRRRGLGKSKHTSTNHLRIPGVQDQTRLMYDKVRGPNTIADMMTTHGFQP